MSNPPVTPVMEPRAACGGESLCEGSAGPVFHAFQGSSGANRKPCFFHMSPGAPQCRKLALKPAMGNVCSVLGPDGALGGRATVRGQPTPSLASRCNEPLICDKTAAHLPRDAIARIRCRRSSNVHRAVDPPSFDSLLSLASSCLAVHPSAIHHPHTSCPSRHAPSRRPPAPTCTGGTCVYFVHRVLPHAARCVWREGSLSKFPLRSVTGSHDPLQG